MNLTAEQAKNCITHLYVSDYLRHNHIGLKQRQDICVTLEYLVWLQAHHPTLLTFTDNKEQAFTQIKAWLEDVTRLH